MMFLDRPRLSAARLATVACLSTLLIASQASAQSLLGPGTFCYSGARVYCFERDANGRTTPVKPPGAKGGSFSQEDSVSRSPRRFGPCTPEKKKAVCEEIAAGCKRSAEVRPPGTPGQSSFPTLAEQLLSQARSVPTDVGAPAGTSLKYKFSYSMSCEMKDLGGEPPVCEFYSYCLVRGDFSY